MVGGLGAQPHWTQSRVPVFPAAGVSEDVGGVRGALEAGMGVGAQGGQQEVRGCQEAFGTCRDVGHQGIVRLAGGVGGVREHGGW